MIEAEKQGDKAGEIYKAYLSRAQYPLWVQDALRTMIGLVSKLEPNIVIESPLLKGLIENATNDGFGLKQLLFVFVQSCWSLGAVDCLSTLMLTGCHILPFMMLYLLLTGRKTVLEVARISNC